MNGSRFLVEKITCSLSETRVWATGDPFYVRPFQGLKVADSIPWALPAAIKSHAYGVKRIGGLCYPWALPTAIEFHACGVTA